MSIRRLVFTTEDQAFLSGADSILNIILERMGESSINSIHPILSAITTSGVDKIQTFIDLDKFDSPLIDKVLSSKDKDKWEKCSQIVNSSLGNFENQQEESEEFKRQFYILALIYKKLIFALRSKCSISFLYEHTELANFKSLPLELSYPINFFLDELSIREIEQPIVKLDIDEGNIISLLEILHSNEYLNYKLANQEIENSFEFSSKIVKNIEFSSRELIKKYRRLLYLKKGTISALPVTSKVIDLVFGKLPGALAEYSSGFISLFLRSHSTIPIYFCDGLLEDYVKAFKKRYEIYTEDEVKRMFKDKK